MSLPPAVSYHLTRACNTKCRFCFATFRDVSGQSTTKEVFRIIDALAEAGCEKLTFAGGEPTLHPDLGPMLVRARWKGMFTCVVTNGFRLDPLLDSYAEAVDWVGLSVDSGDEAVQHALGRGQGDHVQRAVELANRCHDEGIRVKLNTVVTALGWQENMAPLVASIRPERWKVFQVLPMKGQNDGKVEELIITPKQFASFIQRHARLNPVVEDNDAMQGSYVLVDPMGRLFGNATGEHVYSQPVLKVGMEAALQEIGFSHDKFDARGGRYEWGPQEVLS